MVIHLLPFVILRVHLKGETLRRYLCDHCGADFVCILKREAAGTVSAMYWFDDEAAMTARAEYVAQRSLERTLVSARAFEPCPCCGHYQQSMLTFRRRRTDALLATGALVGVAGCILAWLVASATQDQPLSTLAIAAGAVLALALLARLWLSLHDLNVHAAERLKKLPATVMLSTEFLKRKSQEKADHETRLATRWTSSLGSYLAHVQDAKTPTHP